MDSSGALKESNPVPGAWTGAGRRVLSPGCGAEPAPRKLSFLLEGHTFF